jgi:2-oxoglutarate ferredoxin oxidoreductase subunit alpha
MAKNETAFEEYMTEDAEIIITGYGTVGRVAKSAVNQLREKGIKAGLLRPITLYPFPAAAYEKVAAQDSVKEFLCVELSMGQMVEDVKLSVNGKKPVRFFGRAGGNVVSPDDIVSVVLKEVK